MKISICDGIILLAVALAPQIVRAQGTMTYISNLGQPSTGSLVVGSDSWDAALFNSGTNAGGYSLNSIQLEMADASGSPSNFMVMLYTVTVGTVPGTSLGTLDGSLSPTAAGIYTFNPVSNLTLSPVTAYYIVLTAGTAVANGSFDWSYTGTYSSYSQNGSWLTLADILHSDNGSSWTFIPSNDTEFAINATAIPTPEPGVLSLFGLGGLVFLWHRRKAKSV